MRHHGAAAALGIGGAIKLWPLLVLPALVLTSMGAGISARRRLCQACTITVVGMLAFAIPHVAVLVLGTSTSDLFEYATYARDRPLDIFSVPGNVAVLWHMIRGTEAHMRYSYGSYGVVAPGTMLIARAFQLIFLTLYAAVLLWSVSRNLTLLEFSNLCGLIVIIALFTSKTYNANYMIWLFPIYLIHLAFRHWKVPLLYLSSILTFKIVGWSQQSVLSMEPPGTLLVLFKNGLALGLMISFVWALDCRKNARPESEANDHIGPGVQK